MKNSPFALLTLVFATATWAEEPASNTTPILNEKSRETAPPRKILPAAPHSISADTTAKIRADLARLTPTKPGTATAPGQDMREVDKPKNKIPRLSQKIIEEHVAPRAPAPNASVEVSGAMIELPPYLVREDKYPDLKERDLLTPAGKLKLAYKRHPGLNFNPLFFLASNNGPAMQMLEEELRLERMQEMQELSGMYADRKSAAEMKKITHQTFLRSDFSSRRGP